MKNEFSRLSALSGRWLLSRILRFDLMLLAIVMCLITIGFITLFSAGYSFPWRIEDQIRNLVVAAGAMFATSLIPVKWIRRVVLPCFAVGCHSLAQCRHSHPAIGNHEARRSDDACLVLLEKK